MSSPYTSVHQAIRQHLQGETFFAGFTIANQGSVSIRSAGNLPEASLPISAEPGLEILCETILVCQKCPLGKSRTQAVPGEGHVQAQLMFVGEAPGADEDVQGRPFVGPAGKLLDKIIAGCGLQRGNVYIANTLKCRPPGNRDPHPDEIASCLPYLEQQVRAIQPQIIVALGAHAARTVLGKSETIGRLRGQFLPCALVPEVNVMATYHPAYLLRNYTRENRARVWEDMKKVLAELGLPVPK
ncbi:uracil-DNA glycosylase [Planctomycetota bacterium]